MQPANSVIRYHELVSYALSMLCTALDSDLLLCRYVRQESPLWSALHNGVLTSSTLNGALGFYEPGAVHRLGLPKHFVRHGALLAAYSNLLQPEYVPPLQV